MKLDRKPTIQEEKLLELLVNRSSINITKNWKDGLMVRPMEDGNMGSLLLIPQGIFSEDRMFGEEVSDFQFTDSDGVEVIASLNLDKHGNLFELDIWKTDFGQLLSYPVSADL
ncbi:MAG: hypothetical protein IT236_18960 [Bacteroidia bacterium]|nr:hypothetical protein [Bacteroidia bacterium]